MGLKTVPLGDKFGDSASNSIYIILFFSKNVNSNLLGTRLKDNKQKTGNI